MDSLRRRIERLEDRVFGAHSSETPLADTTVDFITVMEEIRTLQTRLRSPERLKVRDQAISQARHDGWTLDEIASTLAMTRERIRAIVAREQLLADDRRGGPA
jgi:DNA-directed RNA polymerase sigma subunit (sigma70/sigma32)